MLTSRNLRRLVTCFLICALFTTGLIIIVTRESRVISNHLSSSFTPTSVTPSEQSAPQAEAVDQETRERVSEVYNKLPLSFEENRGQVDAEVKYISRGAGYTLFLTPTEAVLSLRSGGGEARSEKERLSLHQPRVAGRKPHSAVLRMKLKNASPAPEVTGEDVMKARANYLVGNDPKNWHTDVARFERVRYAEVYPGIDLIYYGEQQQLEYDFEVSPGVDSRQIALEFEGVRRMKIERATGDLVLATANAEVRQHKPVAYQEVEGGRREVASRYVMRGGREVGIEVGEYDRAKPLVIDPVLSYSTFIGGNSAETGTAIAVDASGIAYVAGHTFSDDFPIRNQYQTSQLAGDVFVTKLDTNVAGTASLLYSTYLGGKESTGDIGSNSGSDYATGIAVDSAGIVYVTGLTGSRDFPTRHPYQTYQGGDDAFVTKLDTNLAGEASLLYSTFFGGSDDDSGRDIAVDSAGNAYIVGTTNSRDLPTLHNFQIKQPDGVKYDAFVAKLDTNVAGAASLRYCTYYGGNRDDYGAGIAVDSAGYAYVAGRTYSTNLPVRNQFQTNQRYSDAFVAKLDMNQVGAASLLYGTYLGGNGDEEARAIAVDQSGHAYVTGHTLSDDFPTPNGYQTRTFGFYYDVFVAKLDTNLAGAASLLYGTYLGGCDSDTVAGIAVDSAGNAYVTGATRSVDFPTLNAYQGRLGDYDRTDTYFPYDAFVTKLDTSAQGEDSLLYSTYLGGTDIDGGYAIAVDPAGNAYVSGYSSSNDFPMRHSYHRGPQRGGWDAFVTKLRETYFIAGRVVRGGESGGEPRGVGGVVVTLAGTQSRRVVTNSEGEFAFLNLEQGGSYTVTPAKGDLAFVPASLDFPDLQAIKRHNEITTRPANISGRVTLGAADDGSGLGGVTLTLTGGEDFAPRTAKTTSYGSYSFTDLPTPGTYRIAPSKAGHLFEPRQLTLTNVTTNQRNVNIVATLKYYTVGGLVQFFTSSLEGVTVKLESPSPVGFAPQTTTTNSAGRYSFTNLPGGRSYTVTATKAGYRLVPARALLDELNANRMDVHFSVETYDIVGRVLRAGTEDDLGNVTVMLTSPTLPGFTRSMQTGDFTGNYWFILLPAGHTYTLKPVKAGFTFSPPTRSFNNLNHFIIGGPSTTFYGTGP